VLKDWLGHQHAHKSRVHRLPAFLKLATALALTAGTVLVPWQWRAWFVGAAGLLLVVAVASRISLRFLVRRVLTLSPFVLGVVAVNAFQSPASGAWLALLVRSGLCLLAVVLLANTTPFGQTLAVLKRARVPPLLVTTLALMHRYLFVLLDESLRMRRARASRTLQTRRRVRWRVLGTVVGQLFVRASERAERIYAAMCARGWR
jgi:cobalt/nickel transport system permease protein